MRNLLFMVLMLVLGLGACGDASSKGGNNANNANNQNNVNNQNNINNQNNQNNSPGHVDPDDFDRTCQWDSECVLAKGGDVCGCRDICPKSIASSALGDFEDAVDAIDCTGTEPIGCVTVECEERIAVCSLGVCTSVAAVRIEPQDYDQSCESNEDCVLITPGQICSDCVCEAAGINKSSEPDYLEDLMGITCTPGPQACDCIAPSEVSCIEGMCQAGFGD